MVENLPANVRDTRDVGLTSGLGRYAGRENGNPLRYSSLENPMDRGAWQATVHGVTKSWKQSLELSSHVEAGGCAVRASPGRLGSLAEPQRRGTSP